MVHGRLFMSTEKYLQYMNYGIMDWIAKYGTIE